MALFDSFVVAFSVQECIDFFSNEDRLVLLMARSHPPVLIGISQSRHLSPEENAVEENLKSLTEEEVKRKLLSCRQAARTLHALIQTFCPDPMCVLSLVAEEREGDLASKVEEAVARASKVLPFSRTVMTRAKYHSILQALETQLGLSAFQAALTEPGAVETRQEYTPSKECIGGMRKTFSVFGREILHRRLRRPRLTLCRRSHAGEWSLQKEVPTIGPPTRPILRLCKSALCPKTGLQTNKYGQLSTTEIKTHGEFLFTDFEACTSSDFRRFHAAVQDREEVFVWVLYDESEFTPSTILKKFSTARFTLSKAASLPSVDTPKAFGCSSLPARQLQSMIQDSPYTTWPGTPASSQTSSRAERASGTILGELISSDQGSNGHIRREVC